VSWQHLLGVEPHECCLSLACRCVSSSPILKTPRALPLGMNDIPALPFLPTRSRCEARVRCPSRRLPRKLRRHHPRSPDRRAASPWRSTTAGIPRPASPGADRRSRWLAFHDGIPGRRTTPPPERRPDLPMEALAYFEGHLSRSYRWQYNIDTNFHLSILYLIPP
jgi:hypothetical protein